MVDPIQATHNGPNLCPACGGRLDFDLANAEGDAPCPHCRHLVWFVQKPAGGVVVLTFLPGLVAGSESLERLGEVTIAIGDCKHVVLDLSRLRVITSLFLGMLVALQRRLVAAERRLKICGLSAGQRDIFKTTKLDMVFDICDDEGIALGSF